MLEIRFHGRGGQGALTAARILAAAFWKEGKYPLVLPEFKSERRSAPIAVGLRVDEKPIVLRSKVYAPDCLIILDQSLVQMKQAGVLAGFEIGVVVVNAAEKDLKRLDVFPGSSIAFVEVDAIAQKYRLGPKELPATGAAILGAFVKATGLLKLESVLEAARESDELPKKEDNIKAIQEAFEATKILGISLIGQTQPASQNGNGAANLPLSVISLGDTRGNLTGSWRKIRPYYETKVSPCADACPLGNDIPYWLSLVKQGKTKEAWERLVVKNPLPASIGRICQGFCETNCNRKDFDQALSIRNIERFLGDEALRHGWRTEAKETAKLQKIAVVGAGPAGLSCAYQLAKNGYKITLFERLPMLGGLLRFGIPKYRLPKDILESEIQNNILSLGIEVSNNTGVNSGTVTGILQDNFDAVFVGTGLWKSKKLNVLGSQNKNVISALDFLSRVNLGERPDIGNSVLIVGAGNSGIDAARVAKKLGVDQVSIIELQKEENISAAAEEKEQALREGIEINYGFKILAINLLRPDEKLEVVCREGESRWIVKKIDTIIAAIGQEPEFVIYPEMGKKIFIGGDFETRAGNAAAAIGSGRKAAKAIEKMLLGQSAERELILPKAEFKDLNLAYFKHQKRQKDISSVKSANKESERCFSCGVCDLCGNCWKFCPHFSVFEKDGKLEINYDYCKGCGICAEECPQAVISQKKEE